MFKFYFTGFAFLLLACSEKGGRVTNDTSEAPHLSAIAPADAPAADTIHAVYPKAAPVRKQGSSSQETSPALPVKEEEEHADVFEVVYLQHEVLDSVHRHRYRFMPDENFRSLGDGTVAYRNSDDQHWTLILGLPDHEYTAKYIDFDGRGEKEILLRGSYSLYGSGGGTSTESITLVNVDSIPVMIFDMLYLCSEESFGDRQNNGEGRYVYKWKREIDIKEGSIEIGRLEKSEGSEDMVHFCEIPAIEAGTYTWRNGKLRKVE